MRFKLGIAIRSLLLLMIYCTGISVSCGQNANLDLATQHGYEIVRPKIDRAPQHLAMVNQRQPPRRCMAYLPHRWNYKFNFKTCSFYR